MGSAAELADFCAAAVECLARGAGHDDVCVAAARALAGLHAIPPAAAAAPAGGGGRPPRGKLSGLLLTPTAKPGGESVRLELECVEAPSGVAAVHQDPSLLRGFLK